MPVKKKRAPAKKSTAKKTVAKKAQPNPLAETATLHHEIIKSQNKLDKTYTKFLTQFKKQRDRFKVKIKQAREKFSSAKTSYKKANIRTMIKALEEKKKDLTAQLDQVSRDYKKFAAQQKAIQQFEKSYEKQLKEATRKKQKKQPKKSTKVESEKKQTTTDNKTTTTSKAAE